MTDIAIRCLKCKQLPAAQECVCKTCFEAARKPASSGFALAADGGKKEAARYYRESIVKMYGMLGARKAECESCGRAIWFLKTKNGKQMPFTVDGASHFVDCPNAGGHRKKR